MQKATIVAATSIPVSQQRVRVVLITPGYSRKKIRFTSRPSSTEIAMTACTERRDRYEAKGCRFVSVDETSLVRHPRGVYW